MIRITINDVFVTYVGAQKDWTWVRDRWKMIKSFKVQEKLKRLNAKVAAINFHSEKRYLNIKIEEI